MLPYLDASYANIFLTKKIICPTRSSRALIGIINYKTCHKILDHYSLVFIVSHSDLFLLVKISHRMQNLIEACQLTQTKSVLSLNKLLIHHFIAFK